MPRAKKTKKTDWQQRIAKEPRREEEAHAEYRRQLLATLKPATREFTKREFVKLGLYQ